MCGGRNRQLRLLVIGAHPDDCDLLAGGTAVKFRNKGHVVKFVSATNGNAGHFRLGGGELARVRAEEARQAGLVAGVEYEVMDSDDGRLDTDIATREKLIAIIRGFNPDIIFTHRPHDYHPDHRRTGILVQDSSYLVMVPNICPHVPAMRRQPVIMYLYDGFRDPVEFRPDIVINIDDVLDVKTKMASCHKSQFFEWLPWVAGELDTVPGGDEERFCWLRKKLEARGAKVADKYRDLLISRYGAEKGSGIRSAEAFQLCEYGAQISREELNEIFKID